MNTDALAHKTSLPQFWLRLNGISFPGRIRLHDQLPSPKSHNCPPAAGFRTPPGLVTMFDNLKGVTFIPTHLKDTRAPALSPIPTIPAVIMWGIADFQFLRVSYIFHCNRPKTRKDHFPEHSTCERDHLAAKPI